jgi:hypothetical protein
MTGHRAVFACSLAALLWVVLTAGGCANGGDSSAGGDDGSVGDDVTVDVESEPASSCTLPKTLCNGACVSITNDPKNCGKCGVVCGKDQTCSSGTCAYGCTPPDTLCNAPPEGGTGEGGAGGDASGGSEGGGTSDAAAKDATTGEAGASDAAAGDGGSTQPYCANLGTDDNNCGACGTVCKPEHTCNSGLCGLTCGPGQKACIAGDICIAASTCCSSADCQVTGQICPQPGGKCQCPGGESVCSATNSCISGSDCCTNADCSTVAGATCPNPGQACQCANGQKACLSTKSCIPQASCCTPAGLCCDDTLGKSCSAATAQGPLALGSTLNAQGLLTAAGQEDWLQVTFNNESNTSFHGHIKFTSNPNNEFVFDVASDCKGSLRECGEGGPCSGKTEWEVSYTGGDPTSPGFQAIPAIGDTYIRIYRVASGAPTCDQWSLSMSE